MQEGKPQIDVSKGFGFQIQPSPAQLLSQPITSAAFSAPEPQQTTWSFENPNYTQPDIQKQHAIYDKISDELDRGYWIDPAKIDKIAKRASDEMWLPSDAPASTRALFFIKKNENNPEIIDEYKMNYFKRLWKDVVSRAANAWSAIAKIANEYEKDTWMWLVEWAGRAALGAVSNFTPIGATAWLAASAFPWTANTIKNKVSSVMWDSRTPQQKARDNLSTFGALWSIASTIVWDTAMWALELADNLVSWWMADRKLYQVMESKGAKDMMDAIAQSRPVQEIISLAEQYPQEAKALWDALSWFMWVFDVATAGWASVLWKQIGKQALSKVWSMWWDSIMQWIKNLWTKWTDMIPQWVKNMWEKVSNMTGSVWTPAKEAVKSMWEAMILKTAGIWPMTKEVAMDLWTKGKIFDDLKTWKVDTMTLFMDNMKKIKRAWENLSDTGKAYKPIRELDIDVDTKEVRSLIDSELEKANIKRNPDWSYSFADSSIWSKKSEKALLETINDVYNRESVKPWVALNIRRKISDRIWSNSDVSDEGRRLITKIREKYNDLLKKQIPGLRELDAKYSAQRAEYDAVKSDFFDKKGEIKSDALSKFINISKDRNRTRLERLSKLSPEADDASRAILAYEDMTNAMWTKTATYAQQWLGAAGLLWAGAGLTSDNPRATTPFWLALIAISNPRVMVSLLQKRAKLWNKKVKWTDMKSSDLANQLKLKVLNNEFRKSDGEVLKKAIDTDKRVAQIFWLVPMSEWKLVKWQTFDLPEGQTKVMEAKAPNSTKDITEIQAPVSEQVDVSTTETIPQEPSSVEESTKPWINTMSSKNATEVRNKLPKFQWEFDKQIRTMTTSNPMQPRGTFLDKGFWEKVSSQIKNFSHKKLVSLIKEFRRTWELPERLDISEWVIGKLWILDRKKVVDEVINFINSKGVVNQIEDKPVIKKATKVNVVPKKTVVEKPNYWIEHRPTKTWATWDDISKWWETIPKDIYTNPEYYFNTKDKAYKESYDVIKNMRGDPEKVITIYRAGKVNSFNEWDWVSLSKTYAEEHASRMWSEWVFSKKVKAKDIQFAGDDINEFWYFPVGK